MATSEELQERVLTLHSANPNASARDLARRLPLSHDTINRIIRSQAPVVEALRQPKRDELVAGWQWLMLDTFAALQDGVVRGELGMRDRQAGAVTLGICTDKLLLLHGQPTAIVASLHEVRVDLADLATRLHAARQAGPRALSSTPPPVVIDAVRSDVTGGEEP